MDLQALDQQLKGAIQNHQLLVAKMKSDPQNGSLQKQLHELQTQIKALSERQKQVVQQLRLNLEIKQQPSGLLANNVCSSSFPNHTHHQVISSVPQTIPLSLTTKQVDLRPTKGITVSASILLPNKVHLTTSLTNTNYSDLNRVPLAPVGTPVSMNSNNGMVTLQTADSSSESTTLPAPIRVPQYPPLNSRPPSILHINHQKPALYSYPQNAQISPHSLASDSPHDGSKSLPPSPPSLSPKQLPTELSSPVDSSQLKLMDDVSLKTAFMTAIGLITHDMLIELQSRRSERKRRTTANPQFCYGNWEHYDKKSNRSNYLCGTLPCGFKRPRGRPRIGSITSNGSRATSPEDGLENDIGTGMSGVPILQNGSIMDGGKLCAICQENGGLLRCKVCLQRYHQTCLNAEAVDTEEGSQEVFHWICPKCLSENVKNQHMPNSLAFVHGYILHKSSKEDEKRKLQKRSIELKAERSHLERKAKQLTKALSMRVQKRSTLMLDTKEIVDSIEQLKLFIKSLQTS